MNGFLVQAECSRFVPVAQMRSQSVERFFARGNFRPGLGIGWRLDIGIDIASVAKDVVVIRNIDVVAPEVPTLDRILHHLPEPVERVILHFAPDKVAPTSQDPFAVPAIGR